MKKTTSTPGMSLRDTGAPAVVGSEEVNVDNPLEVTPRTDEPPRKKKNNRTPSRGLNMNTEVVNKNALNANCQVYGSTIKSWIWIRPRHFKCIISIIPEKVKTWGYKLKFHSEFLRTYSVPQPATAVCPDKNARGIP